jgi:hypothetical protein
LGLGQQPLLYKSSLWWERTPSGLGRHAAALFTRGIVASDNIEHLKSNARRPNLLFRTRIDAVYGWSG